MNKLGVFGGSFDPVHIGHLRMALETQQALCLDAIHWLPSARPPHRKLAVATDQHRLAMLELAIKAVQGWCVDRRELDRSGPSYTVDTLTDLQAQHPQSILYLLLGGDAFADFESWHRWPEILEMAHVVVMERPGHDESPISDELQSRYAFSEDLSSLDSTLKAGRIIRLQLTPLDIASSDIRSLCQAGDSVRYLVPDSVYGYMHEHSLYAND